jgi:uncharacterized protein
MVGILINVGTVVAGTAIGIERRLERLGDRVQQRLAGADGHSTVSEGFVTASLLFYVGSHAVIGSSWTRRWPCSPRPAASSSSASR